MKWIKGFRLLHGSNCGWSSISSLNRQPKGTHDGEKITFLGLQRRVYASLTSNPQLNWSSKHAEYGEILPRSMLGKFQHSRFVDRDFCGPKRHGMVARRWFGQNKENDPGLDRDFLVQLWAVDKKMQRQREKIRRKVSNFENGHTVYQNQPSIENSFGRYYSGSSVTEENSHGSMKPVLKQPPLSQSATGLLEAASPEEVRVAPLVARSNLLITRDIEWANLMLGFEQENRYAIVDVCYPQSPVGFIREQSNLIARQLLRLRRPFVAYINDAMGNELFRVRRPFWWINSSIYAEVDGKEVGVVHRRWHLWKRVYDLYLGNKQFAVVENPGFWNWTFTLKDIDGQVLAQIDRDWRGFGFEIFTDAGQYVIRFGNAGSYANISPAGVVEELEVARPLTLAERAVAVALAVSLDNDYFSRHGGWGIPFVAVGE